MIRALAVLALLLAGVLGARGAARRDLRVDARR